MAESQLSIGGESGDPVDPGAPGLGRERQGYFGKVQKILHGVAPKSDPKGAEELVRQWNLTKDVRSIFPRTSSI